MKPTFTLVFILFIITSFNGAISKTSEIDSLKKLIIVEQRNEEKIDLLNQLFTLQYHSNYENALFNANYALTLSKNIDFEKLDNKKRISQVRNNLGIAYLLLANYDESLHNLLISLEISETIKDTNRMSNAINNIGTLYGYKGEMDKSFKYFIESAELEELSGNLQGAAGSYTNLATYYFSDSSYIEGEVYYNKAMKIYRDLGDENNISLLYSVRALELMNQRKYKDALKYYNLSISISKALNKIGNLATGYLNLSYLYLKVNKRKEAAEYGLLAIDMAKKLKSPDHIRRSYENMSDVQEKTGNMGKALDYYKKSIQWKDTIYNKESTEAIAKMTAKYNFDKEEKENKILKQDAAIHVLEFDNNQKKLESSRIIMYSAVIGGVLFLLLAFTLYNRNKIKQKANDKLLDANNSLTEAKEVIEEKNKDITASIEYAQYIQQAVLPKKEVIAESFAESFLILLPKDLVSGDFYWFQKYGKYSVLVMADCTGHGVPGGFMSMMGAEMLNQVLVDPQVIEAGVALGEVDKRIKNNLNQVGSIRQQSDGMDLGLCIFNADEKTLQFSGANRPLVRVRDGELTIIGPNKFGVGGALDEKKVFDTIYLEIKEGDCYYMYSDGYPDQFGGPKNKKFMKKRLNQLILEQSINKMDKQEEAFLSTFYDWKGSIEQIDDVCLVGVRV
jgi:serine phosphatase RsbU (regulator of sigma subunit)